MGKEFQTPLRGEDCKRWRKVLKALVEKKSKKAFYFRTSVDAVALGIPHYASIIDRLMDLGTIERQLDLNDYASLEAFSTSASSSQTPYRASALRRRGGTPVAAARR